MIITSESVCTKWLQSNLPSQPLCAKKKNILEINQMLVFFKVYTYLPCIGVFPTGLTYEGVRSLEVDLQTAVSCYMGAGN